MAEFLDSTLGRLIFGPTAVGKLHEQEKYKAQYRGLLGKYQGEAPWAPQPLNQPMPESFYMEAAGIPGYEGALGIGANESGAMQRQIAQQNWQRDVVPATALKQLEQNWQAELLPYQQMTPYQRESLELNRQDMASRAYFDALRAQQDLMPDNRSIFDRLSPKEQAAANQELYALDDQASSAANVIDWMDQRGATSTVPGIGKGDRAAFEAEWQLSMLPAVKNMLGSGTLDEGEREWMLNIIGDPGQILQSESARKRMRVIADKVAQNRQNKYRSYGLGAPELPKSSSARVLGGGVEAAGGLTEIKTLSELKAGGGNRYTGVIQRD